ncbi:hypothetical protein QA599_00470 [Haloarculaceae archaeon H-GB1-1]|nr:hypothetical protein [Haloarculaceae archaeon H-GB1-1]
MDVLDWALEDPDGQVMERVRETSDEIERRVATLFDELSADSSS